MQQKQLNKIFWAGYLFRLIYIYILVDTLSIYLLLIVTKILNLLAGQSRFKVLKYGIKKESPEGLSLVLDAVLIGLAFDLDDLFSPIVGQGVRNLVAGGFFGHVVLDFLPDFRHGHGLIGQNLRDAFPQFVVEVHLLRYLFGVFGEHVLDLADARHLVSFVGVSASQNVVDSADGGVLHSLTPFLVLKCFPSLGDFIIP